jgi:hypothetical protein
LLNEAAGGAVILPIMERIAANVAAHIASHGRWRPAIILLDDGVERIYTPPAIPMERAAFTATCRLRKRAAQWVARCCNVDRQVLSNEQLHAIAVTALALGVSSIRRWISRTSRPAPMPPYMDATPGRCRYCSRYGQTIGPIATATQVPQMESPPGRRQSRNR